MTLSEYLAEVRCLCEKLKATPQTEEEFQERLLAFAKAPCHTEALLRMVESLLNELDKVLTGDEEEVEQLRDELEALIPPSAKEEKP